MGVAVGDLHLNTAFGFKEYGKLPAGVLHRGQYVDHIYMYKEVKK